MAVVSGLEVQRMGVRPQKQAEVRHVGCGVQSRCDGEVAWGSYSFYYHHFAAHDHSVIVVPGNWNMKGPDEAAGRRLVWCGRWVQWRGGGGGFGVCHWVGKTHMAGVALVRGGNPA